MPNPVMLSVLEFPLSIFGVSAVLYCIDVTNLGSLVAREAVAEYCSTPTYRVDAEVRKLNYVCSDNNTTHLWCY